MRSKLKVIRTAGMVISRPVAFVLVVIYLVQSLALLYLTYEKYENEKTIFHLNTQVRELKQKLVIQDIINDLQSGLTQPEVGELVSTVYDECQKYGYDPLFLLAVIKTESSFRNYALSQKGAMGLMQMKPSIGVDLAQRRGIDWAGQFALFDPRFNVRMGGLFLFEMILKFGSIRQGLVAYNLGETETRARLRADEPLPREFVRRIIKTYEQLKEKYEG